MASSSSPKKRVFIYVPFSTDHTGTAAEFSNPNYSAAHWAEVRNNSSEKKSRKQYTHLSGEDAFHATEFAPGDRIYVHAHGGDWGEMFAKGGKITGKEKAGIDKHTPSSLWKSMNANDSFKALGTKLSSPLDLRIASCHSADAGSFNQKLQALARVRSRNVALKGKVGEFSANTGSLSRSRIGRPSSKGLEAT